MRSATLLVFLFLVMSALGCTAGGGQASTATAAAELDVMAWNIWHGGREDGEEVGPRRVVEVIRDSGVDVVCMQETYGSGPLIAEALGFHFHERGTNVSIMSRYPVLEDLSVHEEFQCVGALLELPDGSKAAVFSVWLPYSAEIWEKGTRDTDDPAAMLAACRASEESLALMAAAIEDRLSDARYTDVPVFIAGDFNSMSHLDYGEVGRGQYGVAVDWPTSHLLWDKGFTDAYRETHPVIDRAADATWTPRFPEQEQDRIDFVFYRADRWQAERARVVRGHAERFPSDHAAVVASFRSCASRFERKSERLRVATYNIKHGAGMDGRVDLERTAEAIRALDADVVALQEVDLGVSRSGDVNQVNELARSLGMHPAFGSFMPYGGGHYGMGLLSRFPIVDAHSVRLTEGREPRVALSAAVRLPSQQEVEFVCVHFDWVEDDSVRLVQAGEALDHLISIDRPSILLGDVNDVPGSRTLELLSRGAVRLDKSGDASATFPASAPEKEIDWIFLSESHRGAARWRAGSVEVGAEPMASDHRPVVAELELILQR